MADIQPPCPEVRDLKNIICTLYRTSTITANGCINCHVDLSSLFHALTIESEDNTSSPGFMFVELRIPNGSVTRGRNPRPKSKRQQLLLQQKRDEQKELQEMKEQQELRELQEQQELQRQAIHDHDGYPLPQDQDQDQDQDKNKPTEKKKPAGSKFDNQVTVVYRFTDDYMPNAKIFRNGNIQMTGVRNVQDGSVLIDKIVAQLKLIQQDMPEVVSVTPTKSDYVVRMINTDFAVNMKIERRTLHEVYINKYGCICSYEPETYPGVKLHFYWNAKHPVQDGICRCLSVCNGKGNGIGNCKRVTVSTFHSGKILITGANTFEQVNDAYRFTVRAFDQSFEAIRWLDYAERLSMTSIVKP